MKQVLINYSSLTQQETKIYSLGNTQLSSSGLSLGFLKLVVPSFLIFTIIGFIINSMFNLDAYNLWEGKLNILYIICTSGLGAAIGALLYYYKIETYPLYVYLYAFFKPKHIYNNSGVFAKKQKYYKIKIGDEIGGMF